MRRLLPILVAVMLSSAATGAQTVLLAEDFDAGIPETWTNIQLGYEGDIWEPGFGWVNSTGDVYHEWFCDFGNKYRDNILMSPPMDFTNVASALFECDQHHNFSDSIDFNAIEVSTDGGASFTVVHQVIAPGDGVSSIQVPLDDFAGEPSVQVALHFQGTVANDWSVDDIVVTAALVTVVPLKIPLGDYDGKLSLKVKNCTEGGNTAFTGKGPLTVTSQKGADFEAEGPLVVKKFGLTCDLTLALSGTIDTDGNLAGSFTSFFLCDNGFCSDATGTFTGSFQPGKITVEVDGTDVDCEGEICSVSGTFKGAGPPGPFACDAGALKAAAKLLGKATAAHGKAVKNPAWTGLADTLTKADAGFAVQYDKAVAKAAKKGGTCTNPDPAATIGGMLETEVDSVVATSTGGMDPDDPVDQTLRSGLLKAASKLMRSSLLAQARYALKPDLAKLDKKLESAEAAFTKTVDKAKAKAALMGDPSPTPDTATLVASAQAAVDATLALF